VVNLITGTDAEIGDALVDDPRVRFVNFTGSVAWGCASTSARPRSIRGSAIIKKTFIELGGKDA
jgi:1-pyrroline-5-carboxylate dehydrogenase